MLTALVPIEGHAACLLGNNRSTSAGAIDGGPADKAAAFLRLRQGARAAGHVAGGHARLHDRPGGGADGRGPALRCDVRRRGSLTVPVYAVVLRKPAASVRWR
jgi:hypothetical protein